MFNALAVHKRVARLRVAVDALSVNTPEAGQAIERAFCAAFEALQPAVGLAQPGLTALVPKVAPLKVATLLPLHPAVGLFANHAVQRRTARREEERVRLWDDVRAVERTLLLKRASVVKLTRCQSSGRGQLDKVVFRLVAKSPPVWPVVREGVTVHEVPPFGTIDGVFALVQSYPVPVVEAAAFDGEV